MSNIINLNRFRKQKKRTEAEQSAEENRTKFGRTKTQKEKDASAAEKSSRHIEGHKREDDEN